MAKFDSTIQRGLKSLALAQKHADVLNPRLPAGHAAGLERSLSQLGASIPGQKDARAEAAQSSRAQKDSFQNLIALVSAIRTNVKSDDDSTAADRKEYGVGARIGVDLPKATLAAAAGIIRVAKAKPQRAELLGVLPADIDQLELLLSAASNADATEDAKRASAPLGTKARDTAKKDVESSVRKIAGAGVLTFALQPAIRADFEALLER